MRISDWSSDVCSSDLSYSQRGSFDVIESTLQAIVEMFPIFSRLRMLRQWAGIVDVCPDASPIIGRTPVRGLYINCGWGTGGFKATPGSGHVFAHTIAHDEPHPLNSAFRSEEHTSELQSLMRISYAFFSL